MILISLEYTAKRVRTLLLLLWTLGAAVKALVINGRGRLWLLNVDTLIRRRAIAAVSDAYISWVSARKGAWFGAGRDLYRGDL